MMLAIRHFLLACVLCVLCSCVVLATDISEEEARYVRRLVENAQVAVQKSQKAQEAATTAAEAYKKATKALIDAADSQLLAWKSVDDEIAMLRLSVRLLEIKAGNKTSEWKSENLPLVADAGLFVLESLTNESIDELNKTVQLARGAQVAAEIALDMQKKGEKAMHAEEEAAKRKKPLLGGHMKELMEIAENVTGRAEVAGKMAEHLARKAFLQAQKAFDKVEEAVEAQKKHESTADKHTLYKVTLEEHQKTAKAMEKAGSLIPEARKLMQLANETAEVQWEAFYEAAKVAGFTHVTLTHDMYQLEVMRRKASTQEHQSPVPEIPAYEPEAREIPTLDFQMREIPVLDLEIQTIPVLDVEITNAIKSEMEIPLMREPRPEPTTFTVQDIEEAKSNILPGDSEKREKVEKAMKLMHDIDGTATPFYFASTFLPFAAACAAAVVLLA